MYPECSGHSCKTSEGQVLAKSINVCNGHVKHSKSQHNFLKHMKKNDQEKKEAKEKGTRVQLKGQPSLPR